MSQNESPAGSFSYGLVESVGLESVVIDEIGEKDGHGKKIGRYLCNNLWPIRGEITVIMHTTDERGEEFVGLVLGQTDPSLQDKPRLVIPLTPIKEVA